MAARLATIVCAQERTATAAQMKTTRRRQETRRRWGQIARRATLVSMKSMSECDEGLQADSDRVSPSSHQLVGMKQLARLSLCTLYRPSGRGDAWIADM